MIRQINYDLAIQRYRDKILNTVARGNFCHLWLGPFDKDLYGRFNFHHEGRKIICYAHVLVYQILRGTYPTDFELDHICRNTRCVNPDHLEPVPHRTNTLRGNSPAALQAHQDTCNMGHPFDRNYKGHRHCSICDRRRCKERWDLATISN